MTAAAHEESLRLARSAFAQGRLDESRRRCAHLLQAAPGDPDVLHLASVLELARGNAPGALTMIDRALHARAGDARQHHTRGLALRASQRPSEAAAAFREALRLSPQFADAHAALGQAMLAAGDARGAREPLARASNSDPHSAEWRYNVAYCDFLLGDVEAALAGARGALAQRPGFAPALNLLGSLLSRSGDHRGAAEAFSQAVAANPMAAEPHNNLGAALLAQGRAAQAEASFRRSVELAPEHSHAWNNLGNALRRRGQVNQALEAFRNATQRLPPLELAWVNLGNVLRELDRVAEAEECFHRALAMNPHSPEAHFSAAIAHLLAGDLARGWSEYSWRRGGAPDEALREALARRSSGGLLELQGEQGLGDVLFFLRWAPLLRREGSRLKFRGDSRLFALLEPLGLFDATIALHSEASPGALPVSVAELPWLTQGIATAHPPPLALKALPADVEAARRLLAGAGPPPYIGVAWRAGIGSSEGEEHLFKQVALSELGAALKELPGTFVNVQRAPQPAEAEELAKALGRSAVDCSAANADLPAMLGLLEGLDEYVGVSSTNVHLRAGLGKGARLLVPVPPEWRYGRTGKTSPWFPCFELYRESRARGWNDAMASLAADLRRRFGAGH